MLDAIKDVEKSKEFQEWKKLHKDYFLSHIFGSATEQVQLGYCDPSFSKICTFSIREGDIFLEPEDEIFKKPETKILPLKPEVIIVQWEKAIELAEEFQKKSYPEHQSKKSIVILQHLEIGQVYNITFITASMHTINIKLDAESGKVLEHRLISLFDFSAKDQKDYIQ